MTQAIDIAHNDPHFNVGDFWNDPRRWDGIADPHKEMFWAVLRPDFMDVRLKRSYAHPSPYDQQAVADQLYQGISVNAWLAQSMLQNAANAYGQQAYASHFQSLANCGIGPLW